MNSEELWDTSMDPEKRTLLQIRMEDAAAADEIFRVLMGDAPGPDARVPAAMLTAAIGGAVMHPLVADLDDDTLRAQLLHLARRFLDLPD